MGIYGALFLGIIVFAINYWTTLAWLPSLTAALKQGSYTFLFGGFIMKLCEYLAISIKHPIPAVGIAILIPAIIALSLTYGIHNLRGTPRPLASTIPTLLIIPAAGFVAYMKRKEKVKTSVPAKKQR
ncbi:MAG: hypothetical protein KQI35_16410 [Bacteroidetes bacterium]|nr:hypothetical protein [Bacteroidota bacterium]